MRRAAIWAVALGGSLAIHAGAIALLLPAYAPEPVPDQPAGRSSMALETVTAPTTEARAQPPDAAEAAETAASGAALNAAAVPQSRSEALAAAADQAPSLAASGTPIAAAPAAAATIGATVPDVPKAMPREAAAETLGAGRAEAARIAAETPAATRARPVTARTDALAAAVRPAERVAAATLAAAEVEPVDVAPVSALPVQPATFTAAPLTADEGAAIPAGVLPANPLAATVSDPDRIPAATFTGAALPETPSSEIAGAAPGSPLPETRTTATLAWRFGDRLVTDPQALATIQAFMAPQELESAGRVRDDLASVLTGVKCARVSATFLPESGTLELRGHIPDPALQRPMLEALRAQVGDGIPIRANLLHLPEPQCGALGGMAETGLPQSTDQFTNPLLIGATAQARDFSYAEGQRLQFDMTAPDYDAFVYVDYFAADGSVIHLVPNDTIPLTRHAAASTVAVGQDRAGQPGLRIIIGPPFGQEIAVAFAASQPLYEGLRPISEPAAPYLDFLKDRIADARATDPEFKGEWVYFFITTSRATQ